MAIPWATNLLHFHLNKLFKNGYLFVIVLFGKLFGYISKNWAIFSKSSGHSGDKVKQFFNIDTLIEEGLTSGYDCWPLVAEERRRDTLNRWQVWQLGQLGQTAICVRCRSEDLKAPAASTVTQVVWWFLCPVFYGLD